MQNRPLKTPQALAMTVLLAMGRWFSPGATDAEIAVVSSQWLLDIARLSPEHSTEEEQQSG